MELYFLMVPRVHLHQCTPPAPPAHNRNVGFSPFSGLVKLLHLVFLELRPRGLATLYNDITY